MASKNVYTHRFPLVYFGWWSLWTLLQTLVLHRLGIGWRNALTDSIASSVLLGLFCFITIVIYRFYQPGKSNRALRLLYGVIITWLYCAVLKYVLGRFLMPGDYASFLELSMPLRFIFALLTISFITILNWLLNTINEQEEREKKQRDAESLMKEAELARLRQQLQPHFLFNSLNSINALVTVKPDLARKMVQQLSDFLRGTLRKDDSRTVKLKEELDHLGLYLDIEKVRFGHRLNVQVNADEKCKERNIPPLLLQPIVENAIKFGLYDVVGDVTIEILCSCDDSFLYVIVKNPFDPATQRAGTGFGLSSVQRRLYLLYSRNDLLNSSKENNIYTATLKIPQL